MQKVYLWPSALRRWFIRHQLAALVFHLGKKNSKESATPVFHFLFSTVKINVTNSSSNTLQRMTPFRLMFKLLNFEIQIPGRVVIGWMHMSER